MIKEFVQAWEKNKNKLEDYFRNTEQIEYCDYQLIVEKLFEIVINPYIKKLERYPFYYRF